MSDSLSGPFSPDNFRQGITGGQTGQTRHLLPHLVTRGSGHVLVVSSVQGLLPLPGRAAYCGRLDYFVASELI